MRLALLVSPHLDDVAFSIAGAAIALAEAGWQVVLVTAFTRSVPEPAGFALACQTDKGLGPEVDYMALRRDEDAEFARRAGLAEARWIDLPEAPHRGYGSAPALFAGPHPDDHVWQPLGDELRDVLNAYRPEVIAAPQGLGGHVDHLQTIRALLAAGRRGARGSARFLGRVWWYRDLPYAARVPEAAPAAGLPADLGELALDVSSQLERKLHAAAAYASQLGFQFGGEDGLRRVLGDFAYAEAARHGRSGAAEVVLTGRSSLPG